MNTKKLRKLACGLGFLGPNLLGFLTFTLFPLIVSIFMVFTNWDIRRHNIFTDETVRIVGLENLKRLFAEPDFMQYFGNTLFFMLGIPLGIAGSLGAALLLNNDIGSPKGRIRRWLFLTTALTVICCFLVVIGMGGTATTICFLGLAAVIILGGSAGGSTVYRSVFFSPNFTAGVATMILWMKLYNPQNGPINRGITPILNSLESIVNRSSPSAVQSISLILAAISAGLIIRQGFKLANNWRNGESGLTSILITAVLLAAPVAMAPSWTPDKASAVIIIAGGALAAVILAVSFCRGRLYHCPSDYGMSTTAIIGGAVAAAVSSLMGFSIVAYNLPEMAAAGLEPPKWIADYYWAKPAIMLMGLWAAVGSNNMLLYLAGLSNIPPELYEAADIDGASRGQRFWHITWPQLAPVTFFIFVMSVIGGLQGGMETARTMTGGGPAGATTTLSYFIYTEGFETGRLGYASAASWAMFVLVFTVTMFNWRFGNKYTTD